MVRRMTERALGQETTGAVKTHTRVPLACGTLRAAAARANDAFQQGAAHNLGLCRLGEPARPRTDTVFESRSKILLGYRRRRIGSGVR